MIRWSGRAIGHREGGERGRECREGFGRAESGGRFYRDGIGVVAGINSFDDSGHQFSGKVGIGRGTNCNGGFSWGLSVLGFTW